MKFREWLEFILDVLLYGFFLWQTTQQEKFLMDISTPNIDLRIVIFVLSVILTLYFSIQIGLYNKSMEEVWNYIFWNERMFAIIVVLDLVFQIPINLMIVILTEIILAALNIIFHRNKDERDIKYFFGFLIFGAILFAILIALGFYFKIDAFLELLARWSYYVVGAYVFIFGIILLDAKLRKKERKADGTYRSSYDK